MPFSLHPRDTLTIVIIIVFVFAAETVTSGTHLCIWLLGGTPFPVLIGIFLFWIRVEKDNWALCRETGGGGVRRWASPEATAQGALEAVELFPSESGGQGMIRAREWECAGAEVPLQVVWQG